MTKLQRASWWCWHRWRAVRDTGASVYQICGRCKGRRIERRWRGALDIVWLQTGEWRRLVLPPLPVDPSVSPPQSSWVLGEWSWIGGNPKNYPPGAAMADIIAARMLIYKDPNPRCDYDGNLIGPGEKAWNE